MTMHSLFEFIELARDPNTTQTQATAMVNENVRDLITYCDYARDEAHKTVLKNIGYFAGYYPADLADRVYSLFQTQHPVFGLTHPTPEEAFRIGMEHARNQRRTLDHESHETALDPMPGMSEAVPHQNRTREPPQISPRNSRNLPRDGQLSRSQKESSSQREGSTQREGSSSATTNTNTTQTQVRKKEKS